MATDLAMEALHDAASENRWDPPGWWRWMGWMTISMGFSDGFLVYLKWIYIYNYVNMFGYLNNFLLIIMQYFGESNNYAIFWGI